MIDADGTNRRRLTINDTSDSDPAWSPDGRSIAFIRNHGTPLEPELELHTLSVASKDEERLTTNDRNEYEPAWSPDGAHLAFVTYQPPRQDIGIYQMERDGSDVQVMVDELGAHETGPDWAPDGSRLVYDSNHRVFVFDVASGESEEVARGHSATWAPSGKWIAYTYFSERKQEDYLRKIRLDDGRVVTIRRGSVSVPDWGPAPSG